MGEVVIKKSLQSFSVLLFFYIPKPEHELIWSSPLTCGNVVYFHHSGPYKYKQTMWEYVRGPAK